MSDSLFCKSKTVDCFPIDCTVPVSESANIGITHNVNRTLTATMCGATFPVFKVRRKFELTGNRSLNYGTFTAVYGVGSAAGEGNPYGIVICGGNSSAKWSAPASVSEDVTIMSCIFHYANMAKGIAFFERRTDTFRFSVSSHGLAAFRTRWGTFWTHEFWIPANTQATRRKEFVILRNGVERILSDLSQTIDVLPETGGAIATGGLGSGDINQSDLDAARNADVSGIGLILCVPQPPNESTATALDPEILRKGFYDYSMVGDNLWIADGGKDFFYPEWIRNMTPDPWWAKEAELRWNLAIDPNMPYDEALPAPSLSWELAPQCSWAEHPVDGEMWSWAFQDGKGKGRVFSELNGKPVDPLLAKAIGSHTLDTFTAYTPISLI